MRAGLARCGHDRARAVDHRGACKLCVPRTLVLVREAMPCPARCPHCGAQDAGWVRGADAGWCVYCGQGWERRMAVAGGVA